MAYAKSSAACGLVQHRNGVLLTHAYVAVEERPFGDHQGTRLDPTVDPTPRLDLDPLGS